jgi:hypothetical protein
MQALILIKLFPTSLLLVSIYGLLDNIVRLVFGSVIGQFVDRWGGTPHCLATSCLRPKHSMLLVAVVRQSRPISSSPAALAQTCRSIDIVAVCGSHVHLQMGMRLSRPGCCGLCAQD